MYSLLRYSQVLVIRNENASNKLFPKVKALMPEHDRPIINLDDHDVVSIDKDALIAEYELLVAPI